MSQEAYPTVDDLPAPTYTQYPQPQQQDYPQQPQQVHHYRPPPYDKYYGQNQPEKLTGPPAGIGQPSAVPAAAAAVAPDPRYITTGASK